jgi:hypothetical protein
VEGLPGAVLPAAAAAMEAAREFFGQPLERKLEVQNGPGTQYRARHPRTGAVHAVPGSGNGYRAAGDPLRSEPSLLGSCYVFVTA